MTTYYRIEGWASLEGLQELELHAFFVVKETPRGVRIAPDYCATYPAETIAALSKLVIHSHARKYAYPSIVEARAAYLTRTKYWLRFLRRDIETATQRLALIESGAAFEDGYIRLTGAPTDILDTFA
jgi:hypothetical protein